MAKYIHNTSGSTKEYHGRPIENGAFFRIQENLEIEYKQNESLITDVTNGTVSMSADGINDLSITDGLNLLIGNPGITKVFAFGTGNSTSSGSYTSIGRFVFRGTNWYGPVYSMSVIAYTNATSADVRIYDVTNASILAEETGLSNNTPQSVAMIPFANIPSNEAIIEIQARKTGLLGSITVDSVSFNL
jgi:hypothetical protein